MNYSNSESDNLCMISQLKMNGSIMELVVVVITLHNHVSYLYLIVLWDSVDATSQLSDKPYLHEALLFCQPIFHKGGQTKDSYQTYKSNTIWLNSTTKDRRDLWLETLPRTLSSESSSGTRYKLEGPEIKESLASVETLRSLFCLGKGTAAVLSRATFWPGTRGRWQKANSLGDDLQRPTFSRAKRKTDSRPAVILYCLCLLPCDVSFICLQEFALSG